MMYVDDNKVEMKAGRDLHGDLAEAMVNDLVCKEP
jgi:hypothetical protein